MNDGLRGRVAIVTGSGANIGEASARTLARAGAIVILADINIEGARQVAGDICAEGGQASAIPFDLREEDTIVALHHEVLKQHGRLDILHNNAADVSLEQMSADAGLAQMDRAVWDQAFDVNTRGTMLMIKHAIPGMTHAGRGSIINTSSGVTLAGDVFNPAYSASKSAINSLTRVAAAQFGRLNIRCNAVLPGMIVTSIARQMMSEEALGMMQKHTVLPRLGAPQDVADLVAFLASDAASFITGQLISVDGGLNGHQPWYGDVTPMPQ